MSHQNLGDHVKHLVVTSATARGAVSNLLYALKSRQNVIKSDVVVKLILNIKVAELFAVANNIDMCHY